MLDLVRQIGENCHGLVLGVVVGIRFANFFSLVELWRIAALKIPMS